MKKLRESASCWGVVCSALALVMTGCEGSVDRGPRADLAVAKQFREALTASSEGEVPEEAESTGTGWGTIRGRFVYDGDPPAAKPYDVTTEHNICSIDGKSPPQETLVVDESSKGIKNVAIYLRNASRVHDSAQSKEEPVVFDQQHCVFLTHMLGATVGQTIDIKNSDATGHNTNILGAGFNQLIPQGGTVGYKVQKETGVPVTVKCSIHPWMIAHMLFRKNNYYAVTDDEGNFEIANLPAGEPLELQVWHESGGAASNGLVGTSPDNADVEWSNRGRVTVTLQPDEVKEIKVVVPPTAFRS